MIEATDMRVCVLGVQNLKHMTLISLYTDFFESHNIPYDIIYIDKYGIDEPCGAKNIYKYCAKSSNGIQKIINSIRFKNYAIKILDKEKYDFIVIWREQTAGIFSLYLAKNYKGRYSINIRDIWNQKEVYLSIGVSIATKYSKFNTVSSEGFMKYLPKGNYFLIHSANPQIVNSLSQRRKRTRDEAISIVYLGTVRYNNYCKSMIDCFGNDQRFILKFIGQGSTELKDYADKYSNIICIGAFDVSQTKELLADADVINCAFGADGIEARELVPIRMYYALYMRIPILTTKNTWMNQLGEKLSMNLTMPEKIEDGINTSSIVYNNYHAIQWEIMRENIDRYLKLVENTNFEFKRQLEETFLLES